MNIAVYNIENIITHIMTRKIYLIDANSFIYRMFFALPEFSTKDGKIVNAVFWMAKFFTGQLIKENPEYIIFIKDARGKNFRHDLFDEYKATRDRMPDNLKSQIADIEKMVELMNVEIIAIPWYEADDVIGTLAKKYNGNKEYEVDILTGDKDLYALVSENVKIYDTMKKKKFGPEETKEKFWVAPKHITDYLAIVWDTSDNIPGIAWFWPWKAVPLLNAIWGIDEIYELVKKVEDWKTVESILENVPEEYQKPLKSCFSGKTYEKLKDGKENAFLSQKLATLDCSVALENFDLETFVFHDAEIQSPAVHEFFREFEFFSLVWEEKKTLQRWDDQWLKVQIIWDDTGLEELLENIKKKKEIVLDTETSSLNIIEADLIWISIYIDDAHIYYINRKHRWAQVTESVLKKFLTSLLALDILIIWHNIKYDLEVIELYLQNGNDTLTENNSTHQLSMWM